MESAKAVWYQANKFCITQQKLKTKSDAESLTN